MECDGCTLCCELFPVIALAKPANTICRHNCLSGCAIHSTKSDECRQFSCAYTQMEKVSIDLRPDNCKVIFEKISDNIFFGTLHPDYELTSTAKRQVLSLLREGISVLIVKAGQKSITAYIADQHNFQEIQEEYLRYVEKRLWQYHHT